MVASKTKKTSKYTYAERVLSAFSQAQKEHRRHNVHLATLRAHVRKIAKDRKDKLGPQWASWVGKTVKKLAEQGVLQPIDSSGYVGMTPEGKKALSYARRKFLPTASGEASPAQEDIVWKNVTDHFSPSGHKRQRARSASRLRSALVEEEIEEEDSASVRGSPRAKRPRRVQSPAKTPERSLSKMTKTELQTKIRELQRTRVIDEQLKAQLTDREGQLRKVQDELRNLKLSAQRARAVMQEEELTELDEDEFQDQMDEEFAVPEMPTFDVHTPRAGTPAGQGAGLMRTQSGSIIHDISMRPTPAPSSPGAERDRRYGGDDEDVFTDKQAEHPRTPESLPDRRDFETDEPQQNSIADRATGFQTLKDSVSRLQHENDTLTSKLGDYKSRAADLEGEIGGLQIIINELELRKRELQQSLADRDTTIVELQITVLEREQAAVDLNETLAGKEASLNTLSTEFETVLRSKNEAIARMQGMEEEIAAARSENERLTGELASSHRATETLQKRMDEIAQALSIAQSEAGRGAQLELALDGSRKEVEELTGKMTSAKMREEELMSKLVVTDAKRQSLEEATVIMKDESRAEQVKAQTMILRLIEKIDELQTQRENEAEGAIAVFNSCKVDLEHVQSTLTAEQATCNVLRATLTEVQEEVINLKLAKAVDSSTIATLMAVYEKWKRMQTECLSELESTVGSVQPAFIGNA